MQSGSELRVPTTEPGPAVGVLGADGSSVTPRARLAHGVRPGGVYVPGERTSHSGGQSRQAVFFFFPNVDAEFQISYHTPPTHTHTYTIHFLSSFTHRALLLVPTAKSYSKLPLKKWPNLVSVFHLVAIAGGPENNPAEVGLRMPSVFLSVLLHQVRMLGGGSILLNYRLKLLTTRSGCQMRRFKIIGID